MRCLASLTNTKYNLQKSEEICKNLQKSAKSTKICKTEKSSVLTDTLLPNEAEDQKSEAAGRRAASRKKGTFARRTVYSHTWAGIFVLPGVFWDHFVRNQSSLQVLQICRSAKSANPVSGQTVNCFTLGKNSSQKISGNHKFQSTLQNRVKRLQNRKNPPEIHRSTFSGHLYLIY